MVHPTGIEAARRAQIVAGAIDAVSDLGYHGASLAEIARRAGVAKSALLYYFASREALLMHVLDDVFGGLDAATEAAVGAASDTPEAQLRAYIDAYIGYTDEHRKAIAAGTEIVVAHRTPDGTPLYLMDDEDVSTVLPTILQNGVDAGVFRAMPGDTAVRLVHAVLEQPIFEVQRNPDVDLSGLRSEIMEFIFRGLRAETCTFDHSDQAKRPASTRSA